MKTQLETHAGPVRFDQNLLLLLSNAELDRVRLSQLDASGDVDSNAADANAEVDNSADSGLVATKEELRGRLRTEVGLLHELVTRLRLSPRLREQDVADQVELWMQFLVHQERAEEMLSAELVAKLKQQLDNATLRDESIRRAIVLSWDESVRSIRRNGSFVDFGGYPLPVASKRLSIADVVRMRGFASQQAELLWNYFHAEASDEQARLRAELAEAWYRPLTEFTSETQALENAAEYERPLMSSMFNGRLPGRAWHTLRSN